MIRILFNISSLKIVKLILFMAVSFCCVFLVKLRDLVSSWQLRKSATKTQRHKETRRINATPKIILLK
jgi:membrane-anchored protein YejM (alkaline phosphatase superfamily)